MTPHGLADIDAHRLNCSTRHAAAIKAEDRAALAAIARDLRYWSAAARQRPGRQGPRRAVRGRIGTTVTIERDDGRRQTWRIVGEDEAEPAQGTLSYVSPVARALIGKRVGDVIRAGNSDAEIVAIS